MFTNLPGFVTQSCSEWDEIHITQNSTPSTRWTTLLYFSSRPFSLPGLMSDICLHVHFLFAPIEREPHGNMDLLCPTSAVFSAARRLPNTEGTQFASVNYVFHLSYNVKLWSVKERRERYFKVIQNHKLHPVIINNCKTPTLTKGTKSIGGTLVRYTGR